MKFLVLRTSAEESIYDVLCEKHFKRLQSKHPGLAKSLVVNTIERTLVKGATLCTNCAQGPTTE